MGSLRPLTEQLPRALAFRIINDNEKSNPQAAPYSNKESALSKKFSHLDARELSKRMESKLNIDIETAELLRRCRGSNISFEFDRDAKLVFCKTTHKKTHAA